MNWRETIAGLTLAAALAGILPVGNAVAALGDHDWSMGYNTGGEAAVDGAGNVVIHGAFFSSIDFGGGALNPVNFFDGDQYLARYDANGNHLWSVQFSPDGFGVADEIVACDPAGNIYVAGNTYFNTTLDYGGGPLPAEEMYVAKFDADGVFQWSDSFGSGTIKGLESDGANVVVTGYTQAGADFGGGTIGASGGYDMFVASLTAAGAHAWSAGFGDAEDQGGMDVAIDGSGNVVVVGSMDGDVDFGGGVLSAADLDMFVVSFTSAGVHNWSDVFEGTFTAGGGVLLQVDIDASATGDVAVGGQFIGTTDLGGGDLDSAGYGDAFLVKFDAAGAHQWSAGYGAAAGTDGTNGVTFDATGNVMITGSFIGDTDFGGGTVTHVGDPLFGDNNMFVAQYDGSGAHLFSQGYGQRVYTAKCGIGGGVVVVYGGAGSAIDLGGGPLSAYQLFLARIDGGGGGGTSSVGDTPALGATLAGYPNPFNPMTTIEYVLDRDAWASLTAYDARGRLVGELVAPREHAAGTYRTHFSPGASGVYLVRLRVGNEDRILKMVAVK